MTIVSFKGFGGIRLEADDLGNPDAPSVLLIHGGGQTRKVWEPASRALVAAGRRVINLDRRGHGGSEWPEDARYDFQSYVEDLRAVLAQLGGVLWSSPPRWEAGSQRSHLPPMQPYLPLVWSSRISRPK